MPKTTTLDTSFVQRVAAGIKFAVSGVTPSEWMTPGQPLQPVAQEKAVGRQLDFPVGFNQRFTPKQQDGGSLTTYAQLRGLAENLDILRLVIETRKDQLEAFAWSIKARDGRTVSDATLDAIRARFMQPSTEYDWSGWLRVILEDMFVLDAVAIYPRTTRGGDLYSLDVIDASTIKRVIDAGGRTPMPPDPAYQQILKGVPAVDYTADTLIYSMRNPRSFKLYGFSPVEQIMMTVNIALRRQMLQLEHFTSGNIPAAFGGVPESWNPDQIAQFQLYWDSLLEGNLANRSKLKFIPMDPSKIREVRDMTTDLKNEFDEWLARVVCYAFSVPPTAFVKQSNRATADNASDMASKEGLLPLMQYIKRMIDKIIIKYLGNTDVEFCWEVEKSLAPLDQAQIDKIYVDAGIRTAKAIHEERGFVGEFEEAPKPEAMPAKADNAPA